MIKHFTKTAFAVAISASLAACTAVTPATEKAKSKVASTASAVDTMLTDAAALTPSAFTIEERDSIYVGDVAFRKSQVQLLPSQFKRSVYINSPEPIPLSDIFLEIKNETGVDVKVSPEAIEFIRAQVSYAVDGEELDLTTTTESVDADSTLYVDPNAVTVASPDALFGMPTDAEQNGFEVVEFEEEELMDPEEPYSPVLAYSEYFVDINFSGNVEGLLDHVAYIADLNWKYEDQKITFYKHETRTFIFDVLTGTTEFKSGISSNGNASTDESTTRTERSISFAMQTIGGWDSITETVTALMGVQEPAGSLNIEQAAAMMTVTSTPEALNKIEAYVDQINDIMGQQIKLKMDVIELTISDTDNLSIEPNISRLGTGVDVALTSAITSLAAGNSISTTINDATNPYDGSSAVISALQSNFDVAIVNSSLVTTMNGIPVPIQVGDTYTYLSNITETDDGVTVETEEVNSGASYFVMPRVTSDGSVMIQFSAEQSILNEMRNVTVGTTSLELPDVTKKNFMQSLVVPNGATYVASGFTVKTNRDQGASVLGEQLWALGGSKAGESSTTHTLIVITPYVVGQ